MPEEWGKRMASLDFYSVDQEDRKLQNAVNWIVDLIVVLALAVLLVSWFGFRVPMNGHSMEPVLNAQDVVLADRLTYQLKAPERLDVIVYQTGDEEKMSVKRIIGLPGETVRIRSGRLYLNGEAVELEGQLEEVALAGIAEQEIMLAEDEYFVLGDNRDSSEDSRFENVGNVKRSQIIGKVWFRISPFVKMGLIHR